MGHHDVGHNDIGQAARGPDAAVEAPPLAAAALGARVPQGGLRGQRGRRPAAPRRRLRRVSGP